MKYYNLAKHKLSIKNSLDTVFTQFVSPKTFPWGHLQDAQEPQACVTDSFQLNPPTQPAASQPTTTCFDWVGIHKEVFLRCSSGPFSLYFDYTVTEILPPRCLNMSWGLVPLPARATWDVFSCHSRRTWVSPSYLCWEAWIKPLNWTEEDLHTWFMAGSPHAHI